MKHLIVILALTFILLPQVAGATLSQEIQDALPPDAEDFLSDWQKADSTYNWKDGLSLLWERGIEALQGEVPLYMRNAALILFSVLLCSGIDLILPTEDPQLKRLVRFVGILLISYNAVTQLQSIMQTGAQTIENLHIFSQAILPTLAAAVAASGGVASAAIRQTLTIVFIELLMNLIVEILMPLTYCHIFVSTAAALLPQQNLQHLSAWIRKGITWFLTGGLLLFTGFLKIAGISASSADELTLKITRSAISAAVPVVGSIISDAAGSVLQSASVLKNTLGIAGMLLVLAVCLRPFLVMTVQFLLYRIVSLLL